MASGLPINASPTLPAVEGHTTFDQSATLALASVTPLLSWLRAPCELRGGRFALPGETWDFWNYRRLAERTLRLASALIEAGVRQNNVIAILCKPGPDFVSAFFGSMLAGATPAPLATPMTFQAAAAYREYLLEAFLQARPSFVVADSVLAGTLSEITAAAGSVGILALDRLLAASEEPAIDTPRKLANVALLQFTSGSAAAGCGVRVTFEALEANVNSIRQWLGWTQDDPCASWLPLNHDMGLIGMLSCAVNGSDFFFMHPEQFVRRPLQYLRCFSRGRARFSSMPAFGLDLIVRRVKPEMLEGLDFAEWRGLIVGSERIQPQTLEAFYQLLSPFGFRRGTLLPAYGLAEATSAVTGVSKEKGWTSVNVDPASLSIGRKVVFRGEGEAGEEITGCGEPLDGVAVDIVDADNQPLPEGQVGEIVVRGSLVASGYAEGGCSRSTSRFKNGSLLTGDAGFMHGGELFVLGRLGDSIKLRGRLVFSEDMESVLRRSGLPGDRIAALLGVHEGTAKVVLLFEHFDGSSPAEVESLIRYHTGGVVPVLIDAPRGTIARTLSGKPKRRRMWQDFVDGTLAGRIINPGIPGEGENV